MPAVGLRAAEHGRVVVVQRDDEVSDAFWLHARAEWGSSGLRPSEELRVPVERFLDNLRWLAPACRTHGVSLAWDSDAEMLVRRHQQERQLLAEALDAQASPPADELRERLALTRWRQDRELRNFQLRDLGQLLRLSHGANFSVPGAGKTAVSLALYELERIAGRVRRLLVVAPLSAFEGWREQCERWLDPAPLVHTFGGGSVPSSTEVLLVHYQRLLASFDAIAEWVSGADTHICLDEAHRIKRGRSGEWGSAALDLGFLARRRDVLTGTPAPHGVRDLAVLLDFLWSGRGHELLPSAALATEPSEEATRQAADRIRPLYVRTTKRELRLPRVRFAVRPTPMIGLHADIYAALKSRYAGDFRMGRQERAQWSRMGRIVMYLLEAATNPGLLAAGSSRFDPLEFRHPPMPIPSDSTLSELVGAYGAYETPAKFVALAKQLGRNRASDRKTIVWTNFVRNIELLQDLLAGLQPAVVHGGVPSEVTSPDAPVTREAELARFRSDSDCHVLLANPAAMAEGLSLHEVCHDAIYLERTFNAGQYLQSLDRIHRLGLEVETRVTFLVSPGSIDEVVASRVKEKAKRMAKLLKDPDMLTMSLPDEDSVGPPLDAAEPADLAALFAHLRGQADA